MDQGRTGRFVPRLRDHRGEIKSVALSRDGTQILTASGDNTAKIWRMATEEEIGGWTKE